jgi:sec-independent protein translocase protein TatC
VAKVLRPIGHDDRLSIIDHLDELRSRLFACVGVLVIAFGICFWQNQALIKVLNRALPHVSTTSGQHGLAAVPDENVAQRAADLQQARLDELQSLSPGASPLTRRVAAEAAAAFRHAAKSLPRTPTAQEKPITIGVGEPFWTTLSVVAYFSLLVSLPFLLWQAYAFVIPALKPNERRVATPLMMIAPLLFLTGVVFAYIVVLPPAIHFLQGYNSNDFDILVQAKAYYTFEILTMLGIGLVFQLPLGLLGLQRIGVITARTLTKNWRYATVIIAVIAAALPGADPVTTALEFLPLILLFLVSIVLLKIADRRTAARDAAEAAANAGPDASAPVGPGRDRT